MKHFLSLFIAFALALLAAPAVAQEEEEGLSGRIATPLQHAQILEKDGKWAELEDLARIWVRDDESNWEAWYYFGLAKHKLGKAEEAVDMFIFAQRLSTKDNDKFLMLVADNYAAADLWEHAEKGYRRLLEKYPENPLLWDKMRDLMERYLEKTPAAAESIKKELIIALENVVRFDPYVNQIELWQRLAELLEGAERAADARVAYGQVLQLNPQDTPVLEWIFQYDMEHADEEGWQRTLDNMERLSPGNALFHIYKAEQAMAKNNKREARYHYGIVAEDYERPMQQALALTGLGDLTEARKAADALDLYLLALQADPSHLPAWQQVVVILRSQRKHELAKQYYSRMRQVRVMKERGQPVPTSVLDNLGAEQEGGKLFQAQ